MNHNTNEIAQCHVVKHSSYDDPSKKYWVVVEPVTRSGLTITWPEIYASAEAAHAAIESTICPYPTASLESTVSHVG